MSTAVTRQTGIDLPRIEVGTAASSALVRDYLAASPALAPFFSGHPLDPQSYRRKAVEVDARLSAAQRQLVAGAFRPLSERAAAQLQRVLSGDGFFVTTGQQTGLFTGPLYTIYKALSAIRLAAALELLLQRPVLALFWCAADDHDWAEVNHVRVLDAHDYLARVALGDEDAPPLAMSHRLLGTDAGHAIDALRPLLPDTPMRDDLMLLLRRAYAPGRTMAAAFEDTLAAVLADQDIALVSSAHPLVKQHSAPVLQRALEDRARQEAAVTGQTRRLEAAGYPAQVTIAPNASNVFLQDAHGRDRLVRERDGWVQRRSGRRITGDALLERLRTEPQAFSPNVLLRPVVESALFPTLAYVGGPAETSYFAQIGCLFLEHGIMPPVAFPRHSVTLLEPRTLEVLDRFGLSLAELRRPWRTLLAEAVQANTPAAVNAALEQLRTTLQEGYDRLADTAAAVDPNLAGPLRSAAFQALAQTDAVRKRIERHVQRREAVRIEQLRRAAVRVQPADSPQERVLNVMPLLARYGHGLIDAVLAAIPLELGGEQPHYRGVTCPDGPLAAGSSPSIA